MARKRKKIGRVRAVIGVVALGVLVGVMLLFAVAVYIAPRVMTKGNAPRSDNRPQVTPGGAEPILQLEDHTCGFLTLSAAYVAHGLSPADKNLRFRLGVDTEAHPFDEESTGTLHPDLLRVLVQDGFVYTLIDPGVPGAGEAIAAHIGSHNFCVVLIKRRETGGLHWVLADRVGEGTVRIIDSLAPEPYEEPLGSYLGGCVLSVITIEARTDPGEGDIGRAHIDGVAELARVRERLGNLDGQNR